MALGDKTKKRNRNRFPFRFFIFIRTIIRTGIPLPLLDLAANFTVRVLDGVDIYISFAVLD